MYGNDLCVADIPGVLVFAVNHRRERVPLNAQIMIPSTRLMGPEAIKRGRDRRIVDARGSRNAQAKDGWQDKFMTILPL